MPVSNCINREVLTFFKKLDDTSTDYINRLIVSSFVEYHHLRVEVNNFLYQYLIDTNDTSLNSLNKIIGQSDYDYSLEKLVEIFELVISPADKEVNGAVYTPEYIRDFIVRKVLSRYDTGTWSQMLYADLSCGCGGFFLTLIKIIREQTLDLSICDFVRNHIVGVDIKDYSVERTQILLSLYALLEGENLCERGFNVLCQNTLTYDFVESDVVKKHQGIDIVIGNPPYVVSSKMSEENRQYVKNWSVSKTGKSDLYLPFFQIGLECLKVGGTLGYITVNSFYRSLNGSAFRTYLSKKEYDCTIIDFGAEQLFKGCSTYTCICIIENNPTGIIRYQETKSKNLAVLSDVFFEEIAYNTVDNRKGWILKDKKTSSNIRRIECVGKPLGDVVKIRNGFATLRNDIYLIKPIKTGRKYFYFEKKGKVFRIEKAICRKAIKANLVRHENDIYALSEYIIFPYIMMNGAAQIISEEEFQNHYPLAYQYLLENKEELAKRDNGHKTYPQWYAYGRSQALNIRGERLLFPHICDAPCFVSCDDETLMYYDGYSIIADSSRQLEVVRRILTSEIFWYYITKTSKPYSGGFFSLEKRYIRHFGIPELNMDQEAELLAMTDQDEINKWLAVIYGIECGTEVV